MDQFEFMIEVLKSEKIYAVSDDEVTEAHCSFVENVLLKEYKIESSDS